MKFADTYRLRKPTDFLRRRLTAAAACACILALASGCANQQPDALLAGDDYWEKVRTANMGVVTGDPKQSKIVIETASFQTAAMAHRKAGTTPKRQKALRALAENSIREDNPGAYTVTDGDTLWDISERFLSRPWLWPEIWHVNPQIGNPHLIYPGDQISLTYVDGKPRLQLSRGAVKTIPAAAEPIKGFPLEAIRDFLIKPRVVTSDELRTAAYIVSTEDDRLISSAGDKIYVRGTEDSGHAARYNVYRPGKALVDPDTREVLGHEAILVSAARMMRAGDPSILMITASTRETLIGDRLMIRENDKLPTHFQPRPAQLEKPGKIISVFDAIARSGQNQVVVLNVGDADGVQAGDVMSVISDSRRVRDKISGKKNDWITIPGDQSGTVMVFKTFDRVSYALIMRAKRSIKIYDRIASSD